MRDRSEILESFSLSVLVAIKMAWRDGRIMSELSEHLYYYELAGNSEKKENFPPDGFSRNGLADK